jgi:hypothetical protein
MEAMGGAGCEIVGQRRPAMQGDAFRLGRKTGRFGAGESLYVGMPPSADGLTVAAAASTGAWLDGEDERKKAW